METYNNSIDNEEFRISFLEMAEFFEPIQLFHYRNFYVKADLGVEKKLEKRAARILFEEYLFRVAAKIQDELEISLYKNMDKVIFLTKHFKNEFTLINSALEKVLTNESDTHDFFRVKNAKTEVISLIRVSRI